MGILSIIGVTPNPVVEGAASVTAQVRYTYEFGDEALAAANRFVQVNVQPGTAIAGEDYLAPDSGDSSIRQFLINPDLKTNQDFFITIPIFDDSIVEPSETFNFVLSRAGALQEGIAPFFKIGTEAQVATIIDNDGPNVPPPLGRGTVRFELTNYSVLENQPFVELKVIREGGRNGIIEGEIVTRVGDTSANNPNPQAAQENIHFLSPNQTSVFFGDQDTTPKIIRIPLIDNPLPNLPRSFSVDLIETRSPDQTLVVNSSTVQILDNDSGQDLTDLFGGVGFGNTTVINVREDAGSVTIPILYTGAQVIGDDVTISAVISTGTGAAAATEGEDFIALENLEITFPATIAPGRFPVTIPILNDTDIELNESFTLAIESVEGAAFNGSQAVVINIIDDDGINGQPVVDQQPGINFPTYFTTDGDDVISATDGNETLFGNLGNDYLSGLGGEDTLYGGQGTDTLFGGLGNDFLYGNKGNDTLRGGQGEDILYGGQGDDIIFGEEGNDTLSGDFGADTLVGGPGADVFIVRSRTPDGSNYDIIDDFQLGNDLLALKGGNVFFSDLALIQAGPDTVVSLKNTFEVLAILKNISSSSLSPSNTISIL